MVRRAPINIVIPMAGLGTRFSKEGYTTPKPLINILARPMISWLIGNLQIEEEDNLFIALQRQTEESFKISGKLRDEFPSIRMNFILIDGLTRGAAETLFLITRDMSITDLEKPTISLDCDTIYFCDVLKDFRELKPGQGCCFHFEDTGNTAIFSYLKTGVGNNRIIDVEEKKKISRKANTGAYGFPSGIVLRKFLHEFLLRPTPLLGEFYTSAVVSSMITAGFDFRAIYVPDFDCAGTPRQLLDFLERVKNRRELVQTRCVVLDLDSIPDLCGTVALTEEMVRNAIPPSSLNMIEGMKELGLHVELSVSNYMCTQEAIGNFALASSASREKAKKKGLLFSIGRDLEKAIGW